jgi:hypothetical protein
MVQTKADTYLVTGNTEVVPTDLVLLGNVLA